VTRSSDLAVEAVGLVKTFGATRAVDGIDLEIAAGTVYGVLGPNGAGKTTTILGRVAAGRDHPLRCAVARVPTALVEQVRRVQVLVVFRQA
jgi:ABC-type branched-subunit amino acid transport system ATPase component